MSIPASIPMSESAGTYFEELGRAMRMLAEHPKVLFVGQAVLYGGQRAATTFDGIPKERRIEMPVIEDFQVGFCTGLALEGYIPVSFFPRWDFLVIAANQIVNHLDKIPLVSGYRPTVILRTAVGSSSPLNPGPQHTQDHSYPFSAMLSTVKVRQLRKKEDIVPQYRLALERGVSTIVVEYMENYDQ